MNDEIGGRLGFGRDKRCRGGWGGNSCRVVVFRMHFLRLFFYRVYIYIYKYLLHSYGVPSYAETGRHDPVSCRLRRRPSIIRRRRARAPRGRAARGEGRACAWADALWRWRRKGTTAAERTPRGWGEFSPSTPSENTFFMTLLHGVTAAPRARCIQTH